MKANVRENSLFQTTRTEKKRLASLNRKQLFNALVKSGIGNLLIDLAGLQNFKG